jgi:hypothetical protein
MGTRFGRRAADGTFEYHDSMEELQGAEQSENSGARAVLFGLAGLLIGGFLTYTALRTFGAMDWPKWCRFVLVIAGGGVSAYVLAKLADLIWNVFLALVALAIVWGIGTLIWNAV